MTLGLLAPAPEPLRVLAGDGVWLATYDFGEQDAPVILAVHGFASSAVANFHLTGWTRDAVRAGYRVIAVDQRGHGRSDKPHDPSSYTMRTLVDDVLAVLDAYVLDEVHYLGYSLGARVGWHLTHAHPERIRAAVLGGIPDGDPLKRVRIDQARAYSDHGTPVEDRLTQAYISMAERVGGNDIAALVALVEGLRGGDQPRADNVPGRPVLFATGSDDRIIEASRALASLTPGAKFFEIPGRNHFNAPTSRDFRAAALEFFARF